MADVSHGGLLESLKSDEVSWQAEEAEELQFESKDGQLVKFLLAQRWSQSFVLWRPSTDWPIYVTESDQLYLKSTNWNVNLIQKHLHRNIQNNVWSNMWALLPQLADT